MAADDYFLETVKQLSEIGSYACNLSLHIRYQLEVMD